MTLTVEDDFREFVAARWPDLEGVAFVVTLDAASARRVTADALAALYQQWREALDEGRPGATARRSVLVAAVAAARPGARSSPDPAPQPPADPWGDPEGDDSVLTALGSAVRAATPLERALVGAGSVWAAGPDEVATLLGMPLADVRAGAAALRAGLVGRPTTRPGPPRGSRRPTGPSTPTSTPWSSASSPARATRPTRPASSRSAAVRSAGARWSSGAPRRWLPGQPPGGWHPTARRRPRQARRRVRDHRAFPPPTT